MSEATGEPASAITGRACGGVAAVDWQRALAEHAGWLRTVVLARLGEPQAVDEVLQEVALAALSGGARLEDASKVAPWLYRLAVRQSLLYRRKRGRQRKLVNRYAAQLCHTNGKAADPDPLAWLVASERHQLVRAALNMLPPRDAQILMLKYAEDWSYEMIARHLGVSQSAVEARLHRARQRLRRCLQEMQAQEADA
ncbi:MAG: RNA polymerase sigma factor [Pirellulales bacterium]|nr:RNA polymerase sigma factor [Pirellulales bacterium]